MARMLPLIFIIVGVTCAGIGMVIGLTLGQDTLQPILGWSAAGAVVGLVASWLVARRVLEG